MLDTMTSPLRQKALAAFHERFGRASEVLVRAPGRINLLGAHIDYSEGWVMPGAIDRAAWLAAGRRSAGGSGNRSDRHLRAVALDLDETAEIDLATLDPSARTGSFVDVPAGVAWALTEAGDTLPVDALPGIDAVLTSDVPIGSGVSSSAAVEVAFLLAWTTLAGIDLEPLAAARLCRRAENAYLGVQSGLMDPFASLNGRRDHLVFLDCRDESHELLRLPAGTRVIVADSGVRRRLVESGFNDRRAECAEAVEILRRHRPEIRTLRDVSRDTWELLSHHLPPRLRRRSLHAIGECERVRDGATALRRGDLATFHRLVRASQLSSRDLYEVSTPELDVLAAAAWGVPGCYGARLAGGGFGGALNALAAEEAATNVRDALSRAFRDAFDREPEIWIGRIDEAARVERL